MQQTKCQIAEVSNETSEAEALSFRDSPPVLVEAETEQKFGSKPDSDMLSEHELAGNMFYLLLGGKI